MVGLRESSDPFLFVGVGKAEWSAGLGAHIARHRLSHVCAMETGVATTRNGCKQNNTWE